MKLFKLTLNRRPIFASAHIPADVVTEKVVELLDGEPGDGHIRWKVSKSPTWPSGYAFGRWSPTEINSRTARYEVLSVEVVA